MGLLLLFLFGSMSISFICSILEAVLMSTSLSYINLREEEGYAPATLMSQYKEDTGRPLAAILSLNTIANTVGAAGVGAQAAQFGGMWVGIVSALTTILILVFSEIIPKVIGTTYWRQLMGPTARIIRALIFILYPLVLLVELITRAFPDNEDDPSVSRAAHTYTGFSCLKIKCWRWSMWVKKKGLWTRTRIRSSPTSCASTPSMPTM